jgi:hypothetical protein
LLFLLNPPLCNAIFLPQPIFSLSRLLCRLLFPNTSTLHLTYIHIRTCTLTIPSQDNIFNFMLFLTIMYPCTLDINAICNVLHNLFLVNFLTYNSNFSNILVICWYFNTEKRKSTRVLLFNNMKNSDPSPFDLWYTAPFPHSTAHHE